MSYIPKIQKCPKCFWSGPVRFFEKSGLCRYCEKPPQPENKDHLKDLKISK